MNLWYSITSNYIINVGVVAWISAQILKLLFTYLATDELILERLIGAGGMPSSHSSLTCAIALAMAKKCGFDSPEFGLALAFAAVVMYDAMGVRRAAGEQAKVLNRMIFDFPWFNNADVRKQRNSESDLEDPGNIKVTDERGEKPLLIKELKEYLGHTPFEVLGGCLLGILVALFVPEV